MPKGYLPSEKDRDTLRELIRWWKTRRVNSPRGGAGLDEGSPPEVHIAWVGASGIPALSAGGDTDTGTGSALTDDVPGSADCDLYRILPGAAGARMLRVAGVFRTVYNLGSSAVAPYSWIPVVREKFGAWLVLDHGGGGSFVVKESDGSPVSTSELQFPNTSLDVSGSVVSLRYTDRTHSGIISLAGTLADPQVIGDGVKAFQDPIELVTNFDVNNSYVVMTGLGGAAPALKIEMVNAGTTASRFTLTSSGIQINDLLVTAYNFSLSLGATPNIVFPEFGVTATPGTTCTLRVGGDLGTTMQIGALSRTLAAGGSYFFVGVNNGQTVTLNTGLTASGTVSQMVFKGGILTGSTVNP